MAKKIETLIKQYNLNSDMGYYEMCIESYINGQMAQAKEQFYAMRKDDRKNMVNGFRHWELSDDVKYFFINLL